MVNELSLSGCLSDDVSSIPFVCKILLLLTNMPDGKKHSVESDLDLHGLKSVQYCPINQKLLGLFQIKCSIPFLVSPYSFLVELSGFIPTN